MTGLLPPGLSKYLGDASSRVQAIKPDKSIYSFLQAQNFSMCAQLEECF